MSEYPVQIQKAVGAAIGSVRARKGRIRQAVAALEAAEPYIEARAVAHEKAALRNQGLSLAVTVAARERSARYDLQHQAIAVCVKIVRKHRRAGRVAASYAALECVEAVRALLPEVEE